MSAFCIRFDRRKSFYWGKLDIIETLIVKCFFRSQLDINNPCCNQYDIHKACFSYKIRQARITT